MMNDFERWFVRSRWYAYIWGVIISLIQKQSKLLTKFENKKVIEFGTGQGTSAIWLLKNLKPDNILTIDCDEKMVEKAIQNVKRANLEQRIIVKKADATKLPFGNNSFDIVFAFGLLHHILNYEGAIKEAKRVLKHKGVFFIVDFDWDKKSLFLRLFSMFFTPERWISKKESSDCNFLFLACTWSYSTFDVFA